MKQIVLDVVGLRTPAGRLLLFALVSLAVFVIPQGFIGDISIWSRLGFDNAPSIGLTRAYRHVLHGDLSAAWARNPLIFLVLLIGVPMLIKDAFKLARNKRL